MADLQEHSLKYWQKKAYQIFFFAVACTFLYLLGKASQELADIFVCLGFAILISYLFSTPVDFLTRFIKIRAVSILLILLMFIIGFIIIGGYTFPIITKQLLAFQAALPTLTLKMEKALILANEFLAKYNTELPIHSFSRNEISNNITALISKLDFEDFGGVVTYIILQSVSVILYVVFTLVLTFYILLDGQTVWNMMVTPFCNRWVGHLQEIKKRIDRSINAYILGQFQVASLTSIVMLITYLILGVPYAALLALTQMLEIIPLIGTWSAIIPCIIIIIFSSGLSKALIAFSVYLIYGQLVRDNFVTPRIIGDALGFHPLTVILTLVIATQLGGIVGFIFALPVMAALTETFSYFVEMSKLQVGSDYHTPDSYKNIN